MKRLKIYTPCDTQSFFLLLITRRNVLQNSYKDKEIVRLTLTHYNLRAAGTIEIIAFEFHVAILVYRVRITYPN